jgi:very-short-patch-repair endonuclease
MQRTEQASMFYGAKPDIFQKAELLRKNMTDAEKSLWKRINKSQLGVRFKAQHPIDIFIVDFYCHQCKIVVELDGAIHKSQKEYDEGRTAELESWDITVVRFKNEDVLKNIEVVVDKIKAIVIEKIAPKSAKGDLYR